MTVRAKYKPKINQIKDNLEYNRQVLQTLDIDLNFLNQDIAHLEYLKKVLSNPYDYKLKLKQKRQNTKGNIFKAWFIYLLNLLKIKRILKRENIYEVSNKLVMLENDQQQLKNKIFDLEKSCYDLNYALKVYEKTNNYLETKENKNVKLYSNSTGYFKPNKGYKRVLVNRKMEMGK